MPWCRTDGLLPQSSSGHSSGLLPTVSISPALTMAVDWQRRVLTFIVAAPVAMYLLYSSIGTSLLATGILAGCLIEFRLNLCPQILFHVSGQKPEAKNHKLHAIFLVILGCTVCAGSSQNKTFHDATTAASYFAIFGFHLILATFQPGNKSLNSGVLDILLDLFAIGYIVKHVRIGFSYAILVRGASQYGMGLQIMTLCCSWICDTGALIAGSLFGTTKLLPSVSPGKTTAGAFGSVAFGVLTVTGSQLINQTAAPGSLPAMEIYEQIVLGLVMGILCVMGDLVESYMKRVAQIKDSGSLFPGHGGCLDRMDSLLFIAPLIYFVTQFKQW